MSEYSVEEVLVAVKELRAGGWSKAPLMLEAFADRIKAAEGAAVAWQWKRRPEDYADEWRECGKGIFDTVRRAKDSPWIVRELFDHPPAQAVQLWEMKQRACRAHALCNELRLAHPEIPELGDDGALHEAIHDILRVDTPTAAPEQAAQVEAAAIDTIALRAAEEIALMWGQDRSQFVAKIQVRIISALQQMRDAPLFGDASALAEWLESLHECNADGAVGGRKWEPAQIAAKAVREAARLAQPAQSVDADRVREVIAELRIYDIPATNAAADKLTAALQEPDRG